MINAIIGRPGSGKSYEAVAFHIIPAIQQGRKIKTNIPLNIDELVDVYGEEIRDLVEVHELTYKDGLRRPFSELKDFEDEYRNERGQGAFFIIDEAHLTYPRGGTKRDLLEYFSLHRHHGHDILLISQTFRKIDPDLRDMIQNLYRVSKASAMGSEKTYIRKVQDGYRGEVMNTTIRRYKPTYFRFYKSHTQSDGSVQEAASQDIVPFYKRPMVLAGLVLMPASILFLIYTIATDGLPWNPKQQIDPPENIVEDLEEGTQPQQIHGQAGLVQRQESQPVRDAETALDNFLEDFDVYYVGRFGRVGSDQQLIEIWKNGSFKAVLDEVSLFQIGATLTPISPCLARLSFDGQAHLVTCPSSQINQEDSLISFSL